MAEVSPIDPVLDRLILCDLDPPSSSLILSQRGIETLMQRYLTFGRLTNHWS